MVVLGRCSWKHHSPQFTVGPFLRDGYTLYMHLYPILVDGYALVGLVRKCKRRCKYLARGLLSLISSRKFPKTELRTHPICFCAASSKTHNVFVFFVSPICSSGAWTHDLVISDQTCQMASCHLLARPKNGGTHTHKNLRMVDNSQVMCLHMFRVKTMLMSSAQRMGKNNSNYSHVIWPYLTLIVL